jgi:hypothetical protein
MVNGFRLLHSTCRGELSNPRWQFELYRNAQSVPNNGMDLMGENPNQRAVRLFNE